MQPTAFKDCSHIFHHDCADGNLHSHALQHIGQGLYGENGLLAITGAFQSHYQAIAEHGIFANAFNAGDISNQGGVHGFLSPRRDHRKQQQPANEDIPQNRSLVVPGFKSS
jgi:hypothetical protein